MNTKKMIFKEGILNLAALFAALFIGFLGTIFSTQAFSAEDLGLYAVIISVTTIISTVTQLGIGNIFIRYIPGFDNNKQAEATFMLIFQLLKSIVVTLIFIVVIYVFKPFFVNIVIKNTSISDYFYIIPLYIVSSNLMQILCNYLKAWYKSSIQSFIAYTVLKTLTFLIILACLRFKLDISKYIHYYLYATIFINVLLLAAIIKTRLVGKSNYKQFFKKYLSKAKFIEIDVYGLIMSVSAIAGILAANLDRVFLNWFTSNREVGIYFIAVSIGNVVDVFGKSLALITHPLIGKYLKEDNLSELDSTYKFTQKWSLVAIIPVSLVFIFYSKSMLSFLNPTYGAGAAALSLIVLGQFINSATGMCGGIISYSKYFKMDLYTQIILVVINIILNLAIIPVYGITGAAFATALSLAIYNIIKVIYVKKKFNMHPFDRSLIQVFIGTIACVVTTGLFVKFLSFSLLLSAGLALFINYVIIIISGLSKGDIGRLKSYFALNR